MLFCINTLMGTFYQESTPYRGVEATSPFMVYFSMKIPLTGAYACLISYKKTFWGHQSVCLCVLSPHIIVQNTYNESQNFYCWTAKYFSIVRWFLLLFFVLTFFCIFWIYLFHFVKVSNEKWISIFCHYDVILSRNISIRNMRNTSIDVLNYLIIRLNCKN